MTAFDIAVLALTIVALAVPLVGVRLAAHRFG